MTRISTLLVLVFAMISCTQQQGTQHAETLILNAADYGLTESEDGTPAIIKALEEAKAKKATKLIIPKGRYFFTPDEALEKYMAISNNDNGLKRMVFALIGFDGLEIDGQGSELVFEGLVVPFCIEHSKGITIRNLTVDWKTPLVGEATVVDVNPQQNYFDVKVGEAFTYELHKGTLYVKTGKGLINTGRNLFFYPNRGGTVYRADDYKLAPWSEWHADSYRAEALPTGNIRIHVVEIPDYRKANFRLPEPGWKWVFKGSEKHGARLAPAFRLYRSFHLNFENINLYHSSGMGMIAEKSGDISIDNLIVEASPNTGRAISTTADATHFVNCKGLITVKNSYFAHMLDDAINVHGIYTKVVKIDGDVLGVKQIHYQQHGNDFTELGDTLAIANNDNLETIGIYVVKSVKWINEAYQEITLNRNIEEDVKLGYGVENVTWNASLSFINNTVEKNRARGILFSTRGKVIIEGNTFSNMMAAISISSDNNFWFESGPSKDVTIKNNTFINCATGNKGNHVIQVMPMVVKPETANGFFNGKIVITGNRFEAFDKAILFALSVRNLVFTDNIIKHSNRYQPLFPKRPTIELIKIGQATITGNTFNQFHEGSIVLDARSAENMTNKNEHQTGKIMIREQAEGQSRVL